MIPAGATPATANRSPLGQLLHALNQPLTGLQCSLEVGLARPRTPEQYVHGLREGLALAERMRALVEAIREVADIEEENPGAGEAVELDVLLRAAVEELAPVAEVKRIRMAVDCASGPAAGFAVRAARAQLTAVIFRMLDSALSLAGRGTALRIEAGAEANAVWMRMRWRAESLRSAFSRPELGLLIARARLERGGAEWKREETEGRETLTVRLPGVPAGAARG